MSEYYGYVFYCTFLIRGRVGHLYTTGVASADRPGQRLDEWELTRRVVSNLVSSGQAVIPDGTAAEDIAVLSFLFTEIEPVSAVADRPGPDAGQ